MLLVKDMMITDVFTVRADQSIKEAIAILSEKRINGLPVVDNEQKVIGFLSDGDIMRELGFEDAVPTWAKGIAFQYGAALPDEKLEFEQNVQAIVHKKVWDVCKHKVITITETDTVVHAAHILAKTKVQKLPVIKDGKLVGIVCEGDVVRYAYKFLSQ
jgi:CBS domain-containing protein